MSSEINEGDDFMNNEFDNEFEIIGGIDLIFGNEVEIVDEAGFEVN